MLHETRVIVEEHIRREVLRPNRIHEAGAAGERKRGEIEDIGAAGVRVDHSGVGDIKNEQ